MENKVADSIDKIEKKTRIAYILLVHNNPEQLNLFLKQILSDPDCDVYIHIDKKNHAMEKQLIKDERIKVFSVYEVRWASFEMMAGTIMLMKAAIESGIQYSHVYYGSGNDLMVRKGFHEFLNNNPETLFMNIIGQGGGTASISFSS